MDGERRTVSMPRAASWSKSTMYARDATGGGGEYPTQDGFGWTNGVMRKLMALYPAYSGAAAKPCATSPR